VAGAAAAVRDAAQQMKIDWRHDLDVLTFSILPCDERFDHRFLVGQHDFVHTIETAVERLRAQCLGRAAPGEHVNVPMILHRPTEERGKE
jgi:hypothetical protein